jgi:hypothetical protein
VPTLHIVWKGQKLNGKRVRAKNVKYFSTFKTDGYKLYHSTTHAEKWEEYQNIKNVEGNVAFFASVLIALRNIFHAHPDSASHLRVLISAKIVEDILVDLLFHYDNIEGATQKVPWHCLKFKVV